MEAQFIELPNVITLVIQSDEDYDRACLLRKRSLDYYRKLDDERKSLTKPLDESKKAITQKYKPILEQIDAVATTLTAKISEYCLAKYNKVKEEQKKLEASIIEKASPEDITLEVPVIANPKTTEANGVKTTMVKKWTYEIIDESLIPREYLKVDEVKLREAVKYKRDIPGLRIYETAEIRQRI